MARVRFGNLGRIEFQEFGNLLNESLDVHKRRQVAERFVLDGDDMRDADFGALSDLGDFGALRFANFAQKCAREFCLAVDLPREFRLHHREFGSLCRVAITLGRSCRGDVVGERGEVVGAATNRIEERVVGFFDASLDLFEYVR